jgi:hypothetical protein
MNSRRQLDVRGSARKRLVIVLAVACVLMLGLIIITKVIKKSDSKTTTVADSFVKYFVEGDANKSYALLSIEGKKGDTLISWTAKVNKLKGFYTKETLKKTLEAPPEKIYEYQAIGKDGSYLFYVRTVLENSERKVLSFTAAPGVYSEATK